MLILQCRQGKLGKRNFVKDDPTGLFRITFCLFLKASLGATLSFSFYTIALGLALIEKLSPTRKWPISALD